MVSMSASVSPLKPKLVSMYPYLPEPEVWSAEGPVLFVGVAPVPVCQKYVVEVLVV